MKSPVKKILAVAVAALGLVAVADPGVTVDEVTENGTWSKVDVKYTLSDVDTSADYKVAFDVTAGGATAGVTNDAAKLESKAYTNTIDTAALFGAAKRDAKAKVKVSLVEVKPDDVQLWEGGPYFATCNIGASAPEEYGYYFWWGDTVGYERNAANNGWVSVKDGTTTIKFSDSDTKAKQTHDKSNSTLKSGGWVDSSYNLVVSNDATNRDAARAHLGAPWRMMTDEELQKLTSDTYTTTEWVTQNGVKGRKVTGKGVYARYSIFLPAAGYGRGSDLYYAGSYGSYWSSTPNSEDFGCAWYLNVDSSDFDRYDSYRYFGFSVRPVRSYSSGTGGKTKGKKKK